jgi:hypothetical protein
MEVNTLFGLLAKCNMPVVSAPRCIALKFLSTVSLDTCLEISVGDLCIVVNFVPCPFQYDGSFGVLPFSELNEK